MSAAIITVIPITPISATRPIHITPPSPKPERFQDLLRYAKGQLSVLEETS
jgi:hypothetical protein